MVDQNFNKTWEDLNTLNEETQLQLIFDEEVKEVQKILRTT